MTIQHTIIGPDLHPIRRLFERHYGTRLDRETAQCMRIFAQEWETL